MGKIDSFIEKARKIHGKYDYSLSNYVNYHTKIKIICPEHGEFEQTPANHLAGHGCSWCSGFPRYNTQSFIKRAKQIHNNKYNYNKTKYINHNKSITIICPIHGEFKQKPFIHIAGHGCLLCGNNSILEPQFIINANKVHNNKYQYKDFLSLTQKCTIICPIHGEFKQIAGKHLSGQGCKKCGSQKYFKKDFVKISNKVHNNNYNYSKINYIDSRHNVDIICPIHGIFSQEPREHLQGAGCPKCVSTISKISQQWLDELGITDREHIVKVDNHSFKVDAIKDNIIYEFYGDYWHGNPKIYNPQDINPSCNKTFGELYKNTINRENKLKSVGYSVVSMWESEYKEQR